MGKATEGQEADEMRCASSVMLVLLVVATAATAQGNDKSAQDSLRGLKGARVLVEGLEPSTAALGLNKSAIQTDVELSLRQAGIRVLTETESRAVLDAAILRIKGRTTVAKGKTTALYRCDLDLRLIQRVRLERDPSMMSLSASTWSTESAFRAGCEGSGCLAVSSRIKFGEAIGGTIRRLVDEFINAWLLVNPK